jgi:hypothetical protein
MFVSLIYVSRRTSDRVLPKAEMEELIVRLTERNARVGVRGALLVTGRHVAQILEGPEVPVDQLMTTIRQDLRHEDITIIERKPISGYRFADWCFAYWGDASYMDQKISAVLDKHDAVTRTSDTAQLYDLMRLLARESHKQQGPIGNLPSVSSPNSKLAH